MRKFNVSEIANLLNVNEETVRRWIRSGSLKSTQYSKKQGNIVYGYDLFEFISTKPKYLGMLSDDRLPSDDTYSITLRVLLRDLINERDILNDRINKIQTLLEEL